jgi:hypothetical protein
MKNLAPLTLVLLSAGAEAQCSSWAKGFDAPGARDRVRAMAVFDDGTGPALFLGGEFLSVGTGFIPHIVKWDGSDFHALGNGLDGAVHALHVWDDGNGPALYAGGDFQASGGLALDHLACWDGTAWTEVGGGVFGTVRALETFDDGTGSALFVGGAFSAPAKGIAKWDGAQWSSLGAGITIGPGGGKAPYALRVHDDGTGAALYAGGAFTVVDGLSVSRIARWNGSTWSGVGSGLDDRVRALEVYAGDLYAGGEFDLSGAVPAQGIAYWDGSSWIEPGGGLSNAPGGRYVDTFEVFDDGTGARLYAGGVFEGAGGKSVKHFASWDRITWSNSVGGVTGVTGDDPAVNALAVFDPGGGTRLFVGGLFDHAGPLGVENLASWKTDWAFVGDGSGLGDVVRAFAPHDDGTGAALYAGGDFLYAGPNPAAHVARWNGAEWSKVGGGLTDVVRVLAEYDDGGGARLFAGGDFPGALAEWNGTSWAPVPGTQGTQVIALAVYDFGAGPQLVVGGNAANLRRWDGSTWSSMGAVNGLVRALAVHEDVLFAGGDFTQIGGQASQFIASWARGGNGWSSLNSNMDGFVNALASWTGGNGSALYVAGGFRQAGATSAERIAGWDGTSWFELGLGLDKTARALAVHDGGNGLGSRLYVGGHHLLAGGVYRPGVARWNGTDWTGLDAGTDEVVRALAVFDDGAEGWPSLFAGGDFAVAGPSRSRHVARWTNSCACQGSPYCTAGTTASGCQATVSSTGAASLSSATGFVVTVSQVEGQKDGTIYFSSGGAQANPWGNGTSLQCVVPPVTRTGVLPGIGAPGTCAGVYQLDFNAWMVANRQKAPHAGDTAYLQCWFRDPMNTSNRSTSLSSGLRFSVCP